MIWLLIILTFILIVAFFEIPKSVVKFRCPSCGGTVRIRSAQKDKDVDCWSCKAQFQLQQGPGGGFIVVWQHPLKGTYGWRRLLEVQLEAQERKRGGRK